MKANPILTTLLGLSIAASIAGCTQKTETGSLTLPSGVGSLESGSWRTGCLTNGSNDLTIVLTFTAGSYSTDAYVYPTGGCGVPDYRMLETGTYSASGISDAGSGTIDWTLSDIALSPLTTSQTNSWNTSNYCGFNDWVINTPKSVVGKICGTTTYPGQGAIDYDIYNIDQFGFPGSVRGDLTFGVHDTSHNGQTPATRPTVLNGNVVFRH